MNYKVNSSESGGLKRHLFESKSELKSWIDEQVELFKIENRVQDEQRDQSFIRFKSQFDRLLDVC